MRSRGLLFEQRRGRRGVRARDGPVLGRRRSVAPFAVQVVPFVFPFVGVKLAAGMQDVIAARSDAVNVIDRLGEPATGEAAIVVLHELPESVLVELLVLHVEVFVLFHVGLILEGEVAAAPVAMEMRRFLSAKRTIIRLAVFHASKSEESLPLNQIVFAVIVEVHLDVAGGDVALVAVLGGDAVIVRLLLIVLTVGKLIRAIVHRGHATESVFEGVVHFLMPL